jgi:lipoprotein-anchoring transpeptidase ErfK/SrfK
VRRRLRFGLVLSAAILSAAILSPVAVVAQTGPGTVTLDASDARITIGDEVTLSGEIAPPAAGQQVTIVDETGQTVDDATTGTAGGFSVSIRPQGTRTYRATWGSATSGDVTVEVRAAVSVRMTPVRLFDEVVVRGSVDPARPGEHVEVVLLNGGRVVDEQSAELGAGGGFRTVFRVRFPGTYRARASFAAADLARDVAVTGAAATPMPVLRAGSSGPYVRLLEARLVELHYRLAGASDGRYDARTADAVVAFHKVQRMPRSFVVGAATWRALADPTMPHARRDWRGFHVEVDQTRQVLYVVEDGDVTAVLHVSTGAGGATRDGAFRVYRKLAGFSPNRLYYPSYFDGLRALHGWTEVPTYAASHGCVRIPYWNARWVYDRVAVGTRVVIYH